MEPAPSRTAAEPANSTLGLPGLRVMAVGAGPLEYQWWHEGASLDGETNATLALANLSAAGTSRYQCS